MSKEEAIRAAILDITAPVQHLVVEDGQLEQWHAAIQERIDKLLEELRKS